METEGYDVLRLIEHGKVCYVSSDYVMGKPMIQWLRYHPNISKELLFTWMQEIVNQLGCFHRLRGQPCFKYVNPYSIIVAENRRLFLLDTGADSSQIIFRQMQRRAVRESFLPREEVLYQKESVELDIYGIGKTLQYLLSVTDPSPGISKKEEIKLKRIISKCLDRHSKKSFRTIQDIQKNFPILKEKTNRFSGRIIKKIVVIIVFVLAAGSVFMVLPKSKDKVVKDSEKDRASPEREEVKSDSENTKAAELEFKMGMLYLLETEQYEKSGECFQKAKNQLSSAEDYMVLAKWLSGSLSGKEDVLKQSMDHAEANILEKYYTECCRAIMKGYHLLDTKESAQSIIRLGESIIENSAKDAGLEEKVEQELNELMSAAYEQLEDWENAVKLYEKQLLSENEGKKREAIYKKIVLLWDGLGRTDTAGEYCIKGVAELKESLELRILHISLLCKNPAIEREVCAQTVQDYLKEMPELEEQEEFQKLKREYDISMEGEQVWVGK